MSRQPSSHAWESMLPWDTIPQDEQRFKRIFYTSLGIALIVCLIIPHIPVPQLTREQMDARAANSQIVHMALTTHFYLPEAVQPPPPKEATPPKSEKKVTPKVAEKSHEKPVQQETHVAHTQPPVSAVNHAASEIDVQQARAKAAALLKDQGLDQLASLRDMVSDQGGAAPGKVLSRGGDAESGTSRSMITSSAASGSGGLAAAGYAGAVSSGFGGGKAGGHSRAGMHELSQSVHEEKVVSNVADTAPKINVGGKVQRSGGDIARGFDKFNGALQALYQRALRDNPALQGSVTLKMTITADGSVSDCQVVSSQLNDADLEAKIIMRVKMFHFDPITGDPWTGTHTINFLPPS